MSTLTPAQRDALVAPPRDYLAEAQNAIEDAELDQYEDVQALALLGIGQQLRRIADQMERPDPDAAMRAYLAKEGRK